MNELKPIENQGQRVLTTEQLAGLYGTTADRIKQNFQRNADKFAEGLHYFLLEGAALKGFKDQVANSSLVADRTAHLYLWTRRGAARHSKMLGTDNAWDVFDSLEENYFNPSTAPAIPQSLPEALRLAADLAEERDKQKQGRLIAEQRVAELEPKATYYDLILRNKSLMSITKIAKDYGLSGRKLNDLLHDYGIQYKQGRIWLLYAAYQDLGYTQSKTFVDDTETSHMNTYWTQKGRLFIYDQLKGHGILPMIERSEAK
ncbi:phage antirepressor KilAC domain-containing protein [Schleiferilactobacillus perolens]|uniref:Anti-repressor n=1 Tax=Schleiferilactobacillus perolens DSM 12744 TaxID=1423792 RepID=A0A0R1MXY9_9LACO|nr:phage antirepressor KilAC domain-containing protein [Schleiferilactobacillus perolens]KRL13030.1 anti-repressor [Schleiferilactobacillus perolens DSM 12744]